MYGTTRQTLARRFRREIGLTPKEFSRLVRFNALLVKAARPGRDWSALAARLGYYDQAHMISEFKRLTGFTPGAFFAAGDAS